VQSPTSRAELMPHARVRWLCLLACAASACLPDGRERYRGPRYEVSLAPRDGAVISTTDDGGKLLDASLDVRVDAGTDADSPMVEGDAGAAPALSACVVRVTSHAPPGEFANAYVCAIWIADAEGALVRTLAYYAGQRARYLVTYQSARAGAPVDATTHATINRSESKLAGRDAVSHELSWALDDVRGELVTGAAYTLRIETSSDNGQGPLVDVPLQLDKGPLDVSLPDSGNLTGLSVRCE
jgi:hypothetical protein